MRINVYAEELTDEVTLEVKTVTDEKFGTREFYGIRVWLKSPDDLHKDPEDDDRSAITFWVKWTKQDGNDIAMLYHIAHQMQELLSGKVHDG